MALPLAAMAMRLPVPLLVVSGFTAGAGLAVSMTSWASVVQARIPADRTSRTTSYSTLGQLIPAPWGMCWSGRSSPCSGSERPLPPGLL
ncbi:hypothetical protein ABZ766_15725 [Streptomyces sp. NPDC006670]|uniref:hypothetical protein n=1 Tax=Streptomyces sp. NPDC006670 TaxID=3154476 RepID=UPI0033C8456C